MNSEWHQLSAKNAQYFEDMQYPESSVPTAKGKNVFPVTITSANRSDTFPAMQHFRQDSSKTQIYGAKNERKVLRANNEENLQSEGNHVSSIYHNSRSQFGNHTTSHDPQFIQWHEGNLSNCNFTPPREAMKPDTTCPMLSYVNAIMIQTAYSAICPFLNSHLISMPQVYHCIPQHPHYHYFMFQPLSGILPTPQTISCINCQPRAVYIQNQCNSCQSKRVPVKTKEFIEKSVSKSVQKNMLDPKRKEDMKELISTPVSQKKKDKCSENVINTAAFEYPHLHSMMNSTRIESTPFEESEFCNLQSFQDQNGNSMSIMEDQSLESNTLDGCKDRLENSIEEIPNIKYMNHYLPHRDLKLNKNHQTIMKKRTDSDDRDWKNDTKDQSCRTISDFRKEDYLFPSSSTIKNSPAKPLEQKNASEDTISSGNFSRNKLHSVLDKSDGQALNVRTKVSQIYGYKENSSVRCKTKKTNRGEISKDEFDPSLNDNTLSTDSDNKINVDLEKEKFTKSNLNTKLFAERPVIFQNGIQEMNITISHKDKNLKEQSGCKYHSCKKVDKICCPSIKKKGIKRKENEEYQLEPEETIHKTESSNSCSPYYLKNTKAIINFVLQQLQENRKIYKFEKANVTQNLNVERNTCNNHIDSQPDMNITDDGKYIIDYNDEKKSLMSTISQRNPMNQKDLANVSNEESVQPSTSTTSPSDHFVHSDLKYSSSKEFDSESGIDTD